MAAAPAIQGSANERGSAGAARRRHCTPRRAPTCIAESEIVTEARPRGDGVFGLAKPGGAPVRRRASPRWSAKGYAIVPSWLFKQEPEQYSYDDLVRDGRAVWDGVGNALARQHLREARPGDRVLFYATGKLKAVVGEMRV